MDHWDLISFVNASKPRFEVLIQLKDKTMTPAQITNSIRIPFSRVSVILKELSSKGLIKCLTPTRRKSKLFSVTDLGKEVIQQIHELTSMKGSPKE